MAGAARHVHIGLLSYSAAPALITFNSFVTSLLPLAQAGWQVTFSARYGDGIIPRARNSLCAEFLSRGATDLLLIDDDIGWKADELVRLLGYPTDLVAGLYRYKQDEERYPVRWLDNQIWKDDKTGLWEVEAVPAGLMRMSRRCIETMVKAYPETLYHDTATDADAHALFNYELSDKTFWGEDYTFCRRWRAVGGRVFVDPSMTLEHAGKKVYSGCIEEWIKARPAAEFTPA